MKERFFLKRNFIIIFVALLFVIVFAASGTFAYYYWSPKPSEDKPGFTLSIDDFILDPDRNDGANPTSTRCYVRATIYKFWYYVDEENLEIDNDSRLQIIYYGHNNNESTTDDYDKSKENEYNKDIININLNVSVGTDSDRWTYNGGDGFYYYNSVLEVNESEGLTSSPSIGSVPEKLVKEILTKSEKNNVGEWVHPGYYVVYEYLAVDGQNIDGSDVSSPEHAWKVHFNTSDQKTGTWEPVTP